METEEDEGTTRVVDVLKEKIPVIVFNRGNGDIVAVFESLNECARNLSVRPTSVSQMYNNKFYDPGYSVISLAKLDLCPVLTKIEVEIAFEEVEGKPFHIFDQHAWMEILRATPLFKKAVPIVEDLEQEEVVIEAPLSAFVEKPIQVVPKTIIEPIKIVSDAGINIESDFMCNLKNQIKSRKKLLEDLAFVDRKIANGKTEWEQLGREAGWL